MYYTGFDIGACAELTDGLASKAVLERASSLERALSVFGKERAAPLSLSLSHSHT